MSRSLAGRTSADIKPSDLHELQLKTLRVVAHVRQKKAQLDKLRRSVMQANAIIENPGGTQLSHHGANQRNALQESIDSARNVLKALDDELAAAETDDRVAQYRELGEGIKVAFLEAERLRANRADSEACEAAEQALREADRKASRRVREAEEFALERLQKEQADLHSKVAAYRDRWYKMKAEEAIQEARRSKRPALKVRRALAKEARALDSENQALVDQLNKEGAEHDRRLTYLRAVVDGQRKRILDHLAA